MIETRTIAVAVLFGVLVAGGVSALVSCTNAMSNGQTGEPATPEEQAGAVPQPHPLAPPQTGTGSLLGDNYWYLPYAVVNEEQGMAFVNAYEDILRQGQPQPDVLTVPAGKGAGGGDKLYRIREDAGDASIRDINNPAATAVSSSQIPMMIAQPEPGDPVVNVLYLDGDVDEVSWGTFPATRPFISALSRLDPPRHTGPGANP